MYQDSTLEWRRFRSGEFARSFDDAGEVPEAPL